MQKEIKNKIISISTILLNILLIVSLIMVLTTESKFSYSLYWVIAPFLVVCILLSLNRWNIIEANIKDKHFINVQRSFDDITALATVFYALIFLIITFIDTIKEGFNNNPYIIVGFFIITLIYEMIIYLSVYSANKNTAKFLEDKYNK